MGRSAGVAATGLAVAGAANAASLTYDEIQSLSYMEMKGTGLSNTCPVISDSSESKLNLRSGNYKINNMCLEPTSFQVKVPSPDGKTVCCSVGRFVSLAFASTRCYWCFVPTRKWRCPCVLST